MTVNIGGIYYTVLRSKCLKYPGTRMYDIAYSWRRNRPTYVDRDPYVSSYILNYYRTGHLHFPKYMCLQSIQEELEFWSIQTNSFAPCCFGKYQDDLEKKQNSDNAGACFDSQVAKYDLIMTGEYYKFFTRLRLKSWDFMNDARSSMAAKVHTCIYPTYV